MGQRIAIGVVGGLGPLAGADLFAKLVRRTVAMGREELFDIVVEQHPFSEVKALGEPEDLRGRKFYVYDTIRALEGRGVETVLLGCFLSHTFLGELEPEVKVKIVNIFDALSRHVRHSFPQACRLGVLTSQAVRRAALFEQAFASRTILHAEGQHAERLAQAIYGPGGIKAGHLTGEAVELLASACRDLVERGAELILPGFTEIALLAAPLQSRLPVPLVDCTEVYADYALRQGERLGHKPGRLGIVGGVGPAATVDFLAKIVRHTEAKQDQDHLPLIVEHNPQIPDRTGHLLDGSADPTIPLYAACKKLEQAGAAAIAIPCNTAHAFVERIQPHLAIPILNMLEETASRLVGHRPQLHAVGLLATSGTVRSGLYHRALERVGRTCLVPEPAEQEVVMQVIYGPRGVKAAFDREHCRRQLAEVVDHLRRAGAQAFILGCTELPLVIDGENDPWSQGGALPFFDPTLILAKKCVALFSGEG